MILAYSLMNINGNSDQRNMENPDEQLHLVGV